MGFAVDTIELKPYCLDAKYLPCDPEHRLCDVHILTVRWQQAGINAGTGVAVACWVRWISSRPTMTLTIVVAQSAEPLHSRLREFCLLA